MSDEPRGTRIPIRLILGAGIALFSLCSYYSMRSFNPVTQEVQHIDITTKQEIALGLQAAPEMSAQFGGLSRDQTASHRVDEIGRRLVARSVARQTNYPFEFHLLADDQTINAFALPGGQVFMTEGLYRRLTTDGQVGGVLGHEIGHVVARHAAEHIAKARLTEGLSGAAVIATYDPDRPSTMRTAAVAG
jgi:predicted Zn-dependent protease